MAHSGRYIFDTGVLLSAAIFPESPPGQALWKALDGGQLLLSRDTLEELGEVLSRPKFDRYIRPHTRKRFLAALVRQASLVAPSCSYHVCRDPKDDKFLDLAVGGGADCLITGDKDLLVLNPFQGIAIMTPVEFVAAAPLP